jgi:DNA-directed RNA polymerase sigma subunit (sigma70/sigma32)
VYLGVVGDGVDAIGDGEQRDHSAAVRARAELILDREAERDSHQRDLAHAVEAGAQAKERLASGVEVTRLERIRLRRVIRRGDVAKSELIHANLPLMNSIAQRYIDCGVDRNAILSEALRGLERSVDTYDPQRPGGFSLHAVLTIRRTILGLFPGPPMPPLADDDPSDGPSGRGTSGDRGPRNPHPSTRNGGAEVDRS